MVGKLVMARLLALGLTSALCAQIPFQGGIRFDITDRIDLDIFGGYAFDRFYYTGKSYSDRNHDRIELGDGPYVGGRVGIRY